MNRVIASIALAAVVVLTVVGCPSTGPEDEPDAPPAETSSTIDQTGTRSSADLPETAATRSGKGGGATSESAGDAQDVREINAQTRSSRDAAAVRIEIMPQSDDRALTGSDLVGFSNWELTLARNEIYARHGRPFDNAKVRAYFAGTDWYSPDSSFSESRLSEVERANAVRIREYQVTQFGAPATDPAGTSTPTARPSQPQVSGQILPQSNDRRLTRSDLAGMSNWHLTLARNEIYARHGRPFSNATIRAHFQGTGWYSANSSFSESWLSGTEQNNAAFIRDYQVSVFGSPATSPGGDRGTVSPPQQPRVSGEILPQSDDRHLTDADLEFMSNWQMTLARNEIYARHGRPFDNASIRAYFRGTGWYTPNVEFSESWLSQVEKRNAVFIREHQESVYGTPATRP